MRRLTFFNVLFIAPVTPELQCDPNPTAVTKRIDSSFMRSGTSDVVPFWLALSADVLHLHQSLVSLGTMLFLANYAIFSRTSDDVGVGHSRVTEAIGAVIDQIRSLRPVASFK
jgi:hypothetical protein